MTNDIKYEIINMLKSLPVCIVNGAETEYTVRCPYCGDSQKDLRHGHMGIHIDVNDSSSPIFYRCLKCDARGIVTNEVLNDLQLSPSIQTTENLRNYNRKIIKKNKLVNSNSENYAVPLYTSSTLNDMKLKYISMRLGIDLTYQDAHDLKVVIDIFEFIKFNEINAIPGVSFNKLNFLNNNYVGWLSTNNNCITFRRISDNPNMMRYIKITLNPANVNGNTFYSIPNKIDLMYTDDINIHIAEGTFDIVSVFKNVMNSNLDKNYYYASCGFGFLTIIKYLIANGINTGLNIHIYSDNDKSDSDHTSYLFKNSDVNPWINHIYIHRNGFENEKDYGVPSERIIDTKRKLK